MLSLATQESENPDLRDRGFIYWRLLSTDPAATKDVVPAEKPLITEETDLLEPTLVDRQSGVKTLVDRLLVRIGDSDEMEDSNPELAAAWVVTLVQAMLGHVTHTCLTISPARVEDTCLETWLASPSPLLAQMIGLLCRVAGLDDSSKVEALVNLAAGGKLEAKTLVEARIFTDRDLISEKSDSGGDKVSEGWMLVKDYYWDSVPPDKILGSGTDWSSLARQCQVE